MFCKNGKCLQKDLGSKGKIWWASVIYSQRGICDEVIAILLLKFAFKIFESPFTQMLLNVLFSFINLIHCSLIFRTYSKWTITYDVSVKCWAFKNVLLVIVIDFGRHYLFRSREIKHNLRSFTRRKKTNFPSDWKII